MTRPQSEMKLRDLLIEGRDKSVTKVHKCKVLLFSHGLSQLVRVVFICF